MTHSPYDDLAAEYYDRVRHPTCANFRDASGILLRSWLDVVNARTGWICEVGPGKSLWAEIMSPDAARLCQLVLIDSSPLMLAHSKPLWRAGARMIVGDASRLPLVSEAVDVVVAVLGDSYNLPSFWRESARVLRPGASIVFTSPSYEWACVYRTGSASGSAWAEFELSDMSRLVVPSFINSQEDQTLLIEDCELVVKRVAQVPLSVLRSDQISPKLRGFLGADDPVVTGYYATKPA